MSIFDTLTALADAIRAKTGITENLTLEQMTRSVETITGDGIDTADATATAGDLALGVTAYAGGEKITGTLPTAAYLITTDPQAGQYIESGGEGVQFSAFPPEGSSRKIVGEDTKVIIKVPATQLGDATAADVRAGKTFTSAAGLKVTGTMEV